MSWLAERLPRLMAQRHETVADVARRLGIERSRLNNIVTGTALPNDNLIRRLARHFGEDPDTWVGHVKETDDGSPRPELPAGFLKVAAAADIPDGEMKIVFNDLVVVAKAGGRFHAFGNVCPHAAGPIGEGFLEGCIVECPWHAGQWDITTGQGLTAFATADIPVFEVRVTGEDIEVRLTPAVLRQYQGSGGGNGAP